MRSRKDVRETSEKSMTVLLMEKKMWSIFGALSILSFLVSPVGQSVIRNLTDPPQASMMEVEITRSIG